MLAPGELTQLRNVTHPLPNQRKRLLASIALFSLCCSHHVTSRMPIVGWVSDVDLNDVEFNTALTLARALFFRKWLSASGLKVFWCHHKLS